MNAKNILSVFFILFGFLLAACSPPGLATIAPESLSPSPDAQVNTPTVPAGVTPESETLTDTPTPEGPDEFSTDNLNEIPPDGILKEIEIGRASCRERV